MVKAMLAKEYSPNDPKIDPVAGHWLVSEKLDGYRALYEGKQDQFMSRQEKPFNCPPWFTKSFPKRYLDGELWIDRDKFQAMGVVRKKTPIDEEWMNVTYQVYDLIDSKKPFFERVKELKRVVKLVEGRRKVYQKELSYPLNKLPCPLVFVEQIPIQSQEHLKEMYEGILAKGGEGVMLKDPNSDYEFGKRSSKLLKYKPNFDAEAIIIDYKMGEGKYTGMLGSFICKPLLNHDTYMSVDPDDNHIFTLSGMDDKIRKSFKETHSEGTIITYECSGFTDKGVPRFGRYQRIRDDVIIKEHHVDSESRETLDRVISIMSKLENHYKANYDSFRAKTYMTVNKALKTLNSDKDLEPKNLKSVKGIGQGTIDRIKEIIDTGTLQEYEKVKDKKSPLEEFLKIHGVGKQHAKKLVGKGFKSIDDLRDCETIKDHLNDTQLKGLKYYDDVQQRIPYQEIQNHEAFLKDLLRMIDPEAELTIAGSYRRKSKDSGDIDLLLKASSKKTYDTFIDNLKKGDYLVEDLARGPKKYMGMGKGIDSPYKRRIDIMYTKPEEYPFAILYFTGSGDFNVRMREDALKQGYTMNEYSIKHTDTKKQVDKIFKGEKEIFDFLGYEYLKPEKRIQ